MHEGHIPDGMKKKKLPMYISVYNRLCDFIADMEPGAKLPTEEMLIRQFAVSRNTLRQALQLLEEDRLINRRQGSGAYVSRRPFMHSASVNRYSTIETLLDKLDFSWELACLEISVQNVDELESEILSLPKGSLIHVFDRVYRDAKENDIVFAHLLDFVPLTTKLEFPRSGRKEEIVRYVEGKGHSSSCIVTAIIAGSLYANIFKVKANTPLLLLQQLVSDEIGTPIFFNKTIINSSVNGLTLRVDRI